MVGQDTKIPFVPTMVCAGIGGSVAETLTLPFDTVKVRLMTSGTHYKGMLDCGLKMAKEEGVASLWKGWTPGIHRQLVYCSLRLALYTEMSKWVIGEGNSSPTLLQKIQLGLLSGGVAISIANPTEVVKIRIQGDMRNPGAAPRYSGALNAYSTILKEETLKGFWVGCLPNVIRNSVINAAELSAYFQIKQWVLEYNLMEDRLPCHFFCGFMAGFVAVVVGNPVDMMKTRIMNAKKGTGEAYKNIADCFLKTLKNEGFGAFYSGFFANVIRIGSWNIAMFVAFEALKKKYYDKFIA